MQQKFCNQESGGKGEFVRPVNLFIFLILGFAMTLYPFSEQWIGGPGKEDVLRNFAISFFPVFRIIADEATRFFKVRIPPHRAGTQVFQVFIRFPYYPAVIFPMYSILRNRQPKAFPRTAFSDKIVEVICPFIVMAPIIPMGKVTERNIS